MFPRSPEVNLSSDFQYGQIELKIWQEYSSDVT